LNDLPALPRTAKPRTRTVAGDRVAISVVIPAFNEEEVLDEAYRRLAAVMDRLGRSYELIFVDDGSQDATPLILGRIADGDRRVRVLGLSRNFGHQVAISAGVDHARGDAVVVIDADLQDPPEVIPRLVARWQEGYEVVYGKRLARRGESPFKTRTAALFYRILRRLTTIEIPVDTGDFRLVDRKVCEALRRLPERNRYVRGLVSWVGFRQSSVEYERHERFAGRTKYPLGKMLHFALDAITSFSDRPLRLATYLGFAASGVSFLYLIVTVVLKLRHLTVPGWASIVAVSVFFHGITLIILGIQGEYVGRIHEEVKNRPLYIVDRALGFGGDGESTQA
jgi:glycosyltransferase involved in cell wall biosynthesis